MPPRDPQRHNAVVLLGVAAAFACAAPVNIAAAASIESPRLRLTQAENPARDAAPASPQPDRAPPPAATPAGKPEPAAAETPALVINGQQVESILGKKVRNSTGDDIGRIVDIIVDKSGQIRAAIIDFGGFLGVGSRQIAIDWRAIRFNPDSKIDAVSIDLSKDQLRVAPVYKAGEQIVILSAPATPSASAKPAAPAASPLQDTAPENRAPKDPAAK